MQLTPIGYISRAHGLKGHVILKSNQDIDENITAFFVEVNGSQAPFFIEEFKVFGNDHLVKIESVNSIDEANKLKNCTVFADEKFVLHEEEFEFLHFVLIDKEKGEVGVIEELIDTPGNPLLRIMRNEKEILLPFNEAFIQKIDKSKKQIFYTAPEGLLEMYF